MFLVLAVLCLVLILQLALSSTSNAAATTAPNYSLAQIAYGPTSPIGNCPGWSGDSDAAGHIYIVCPIRSTTSNPYVLEFDATGHYLGAATLPPQYFFAKADGSAHYAIDVTVTGDGTALYVSVGPNIDFPAAGPQGSVVRLTRPAGAVAAQFAQDPAFTAGPWGPVLVDGQQKYTAARNVDVDASGRLYVSTSFWVLELNPATGAVVSRMGGGATTSWPGGPWVEGLNKPQGIAVAADGNSLFVVEQQFSIIQRWVRTAPTEWKRDTTWGPNGNGLLGVPTGANDQFCAQDTTFQSPYDIAIDDAGDMYVDDVSCRRIQRFTGAGAFVQTVWRNDPGATENHGFAVNGQGSMILPEPRMLLVRSDPAQKPAPAAPAPAPCTDRTAPVIATATGPRSTTSRTASIVVTATDDCSGPQELRVVGARSGAANWVAGLTQSVTLSGWNGRKRLVVQARDGSGRISAARVVYVQLALPQPRLIARRTAQLAGRGCSSKSPLARVGGGSAYTVADRCAALAGSVTRLIRTSTGYQIEVLVSAATARAIYVNAVGPVRIWVVSDRATSIRRAPRAGRRVSLLGTVVVLRNRSAAFGIPMDRIIGS
jgi:hypothetical protein